MKPLAYASLLAAIFSVACSTQKPTAKLEVKTGDEGPTLEVCYDIASGKTLSPPTELLNACKAKFPKFFQGDDQPLTMAGGSLLVYSKGDWTPVTATDNFSYYGNGPITDFYVFYSDSAKDDGDGEMQLKVADPNVLTIQFYMNASLKSVVTKSSGSLILNPKKPIKKFKRFLKHNENWDRMQITGLTGATSFATCTASAGGTVLSCEAKNGLNYGFRLHAPHQ